MRRLSRLDRSIGRLRPGSTTSSPSVLCSACLRRAPFSTSTRNSGELSTTERLRRKIWGTDNPPGFKDPYAGPNAEELAQMERERKEEELKKLGIVPKPKPTQSKTSSTDLDPTYAPAKSWDGLEEVGESPAPEYYFEGFMPVEPVTDTQEATAALRRAVVEVLTLRQAGRPLSELSNASIEDDQTRGIQLSVLRSDPCVPLLQFSENSSAQAILDSLSQPEEHMDEEESTETIEGEAITEAVLEPEISQDGSVVGDGMTKDPHILDVPLDESPEAIATPLSMDPDQRVVSWDPSWLQVSLKDPDIKFAVVKRVTQLTGNRIPDSTVNGAHTVRSLLANITKKPKPAKLFDALVDRQDLVALPNVKLFHRRITPIDKEIVVGRWKIIEKELASRGLPITGH